jgi:hypothetical protein
MTSMYGGTMLIQGLLHSYSKSTLEKDDHAGGGRELR